MKLFSPFRCVALVTFIPQSWPAESSRQRAERGGVVGRRRREEGRGKRR